MYKLDDLGEKRDEASFVLQEKPPIEQEHRSLPQILTIISATLPALTYGVLFAWPSPAIPKLINEAEGYDITLEQASYLSVIPPITAIFISPFYGWLVDAIGRKFTILSIAVPHLLSWMLVAFADNIWVFYLSRVICGVADACMYASIPIYISEVATPKIRGTWGNAMTFFIYFGQLVANGVGSQLSIQNSAFVFACIPILFLCTYSFAPESPYYCLMKGRHEDAARSLRKLRGLNNVDGELAQLQADVNRQISESGTWRDLFMIDSNRRALYAVIFLRIAQQLSGALAFFVYTQYFFEQAGGNLSAADSACILSGIVVMVNIFAASVLDKIGRRMAMMISSAASALVLYVEMTYFFLSEKVPDVDVSHLTWLPLVGMAVFVLVYQLGAGILPNLMMGELFSQSIKGKGLIVTNIIFNICVSGFTKLFQVLTSNFGLFAPFAFFGTCTLINTFLSYYLVPETKGKTLEEIQQELKMGRRKR